MGTAGRVVSRIRGWQPAAGVLLMALSFAGYLDSLYLTVAHYRGGVPGCRVIEGCESVLTSRYSVILGIPVALVGTVFFAAVFYLSIASIVYRRRATIIALRVVSCLGLLVSLFFFLVQALVIHAYCQYCIASEVLALVIFLVSLAYGRARTD